MTAARDEALPDPIGAGWRSSSGAKTSRSGSRSPASRSREFLDLFLDRRRLDRPRAAAPRPRVVEPPGRHRGHGRSEHRRSRPRRGAVRSARSGDTAPLPIPPRRRTAAARRSGGVRGSAACRDRRPGSRRPDLRRARRAPEARGRAGRRRRGRRAPRGLPSRSRGRRGDSRRASTARSDREARLPPPRRASRGAAGTLPATGRRVKSARAGRTAAPTASAARKRREKRELVPPRLERGRNALVRCERRRGRVEDARQAGRLQIADQPLGLFLVRDDDGERPAEVSSPARRAGVPEALPRRPPRRDGPRRCGPARTRSA